MSTPQRIAIGFIAAVLSVLVFHQGMILLMRETGLFGISPTTLVWNIRPNPRAFTLPFIVNQCFWGGLYGAVFGLLAPRVRFPLWLWGLIVGASTTLVGMFVVAAIRGTPIGGGWQLMARPTRRAISAACASTTCTRRSTTSVCAGRSRLR